ncbi:MlaD family protein, partial [Nocardia wallacei]
MSGNLRGLGGPLTKLAIFIVVTLFATALLGVTIANYSGGGPEFKARFTDVTSLNKGDEVRIAGVRVGKVTKVSVVG